MNIQEERLDVRDIGRQLGADGVNSVVTKSEQYCAYAERRIAVKNRPNILSLKAEFSLLRDEEQRLQDRLRDAPPPGDLRHHRRKAVYSGIIAAALTIGGFYLVLLTFEPFRLGAKAYFYCLAIALVSPFLVHKLLEDFRLEALVKTLTVFATIAGLASLMLFAVIRGDLLAQQLQTTPSVVIDDAQPAQESPNTFYGSAVGLLRLATVLLSFAMELAAGLALHAAWVRPPHSSEDWEELRAELSQVHQKMVAHVFEITALENESSLFVAQFWRDFYGSMLRHTVRNAMTKLLLLAIGVLLIPHARAESQPHLNLVVAIDLSRSVAVGGPDGTTEFQKNVDGVTRVLGQVPSGSHITVLGITDHSFAQPYILLKASIPDDPGYFGERLNVARMELVRAWKSRSVRLQPSFPSTDILGALIVASQIYHQQPMAGDQRMLVLFSDMRNHTHDLDLESLPAMPALGRIGNNADAVLVDLHQVQVYVLGVDGSSKSVAYWKKLEKFWTGYFQDSGATLARFTVLREFPTIHEWDDKSDR